MSAWRLDIFEAQSKALFGLRRQSGAATALCFRSRTKALDEVSCLIIRSKAASRFACRRSPKDTSDPGIRFVGRTYRLDTKRVFDVATLGARASRPPRSGQRPLQWPSATIADGTSALPGRLRRSKNVQSPDSRFRGNHRFWCIGDVAHAPVFVISVRHPRWIVSRGGIQFCAWIRLVTSKRPEASSCIGRHGRRSRITPLFDRTAASFSACAASHSRGI